MFPTIVPNIVFPYLVMESFLPGASIRLVFFGTFFRKECFLVTREALSSALEDQFCFTYFEPRSVFCFVLSVSLNNLGPFQKVFLLQS